MKKSVKLPLGKRPTPPSPKTVISTQTADERIRETEGNLAEAIRSGMWIAIAIRVENGKILIERTHHNFLLADVPKAIELVAENLKTIG